MPNSFFTNFFILIKQKETYLLRQETYHILKKKKKKNRPSFIYYKGLKAMKPMIFLIISTIFI